MVPYYDQVAAIDVMAMPQEVGCPELRLRQQSLEGGPLVGEAPLTEALPAGIHLSVHSVLLVDIHAKIVHGCATSFLAIGLWPS